MAIISSKKNTMGTGEQLLRGLFVLLAIILLGIGVIGGLTMRQLYTYGSVSETRNTAVLRVSSEAKSRINESTQSLHNGMQLSSWDDRTILVQNEEQLRRSMGDAATLMAALTWGTEGEAFMKSAEGLNWIQWQQSPLKDLKMDRPDEVTTSLASNTSLYLAGTLNNSLEAFAAKKSALRLADAHQIVEATKRQKEADENSERAEKFAELAKDQLAVLDKYSLSLSQSNSVAAQRLVKAGTWGLWLTLFVTTMSVLAVGLLWSHFNLFKPLRLLARASRKSDSGEFATVPVTNTGLVSPLAENFNSLVSQLKQYQSSLTSAESIKKEALSEQGKLFEDTKRAMINLLRDSKELEDQLVTEKSHVEQKVIERTKELQAEQARLEASVNSLSVGFIMTDNQYRLITINPEASKVLWPGNKRPESPTFADVEARLNGTTLNLKEFIDSSWQQKKSLEINELLLDSKFLHLYAAPIFQPGQSEPLGAVVLLEDVTEEKVMMRSKDEFFSIASHELRTPLTAIRGNTAMIKSYYPEILKDESLKEIIDDIHSSSIRLIEIVNDFLDASRLEQGKMEFNLEPIDIAPVIKSVVDEMAQVGNEKGIYIKTEIEADKYPLVMTDKDRIKQVVYNLIGNAMKFTEEGGITLRVEPSSGFIKILVEDTGRGIPADKQSLLFRKFQQAGNSLITRDTTRGTGLGLYISKLLAEKMGGKINLEHSEEGKGSVFSFTIPIANGEASTNDTQT